MTRRVQPKNLDNCIGESGKKASHGCLIPELESRDVAGNSCVVLSGEG